MSSDTPFVSFVVPTRDRPQFVRWCLASIAAQSDGDFEVIVSDNPTTAPVEDVVSALKDERFRYVRPDYPVSMCENWEHALTQVRGEYVAFLTDKMAVFPSTVAALRDATRSVTPEVVSWRTAGYYPLDEERDLGPGYSVPAKAPVEPVAYALREVLEEWLAFREPMQRKGPEVLLGKICFGAYRSDFVDRIQARVGRVFLPIAPDYSSLGAATIVGQEGLDLGRAQVMGFESNVSNGKRFASDALHARRFMRETDPSGALLDALPIPHLYASAHNVIAHDLVMSARLAGGGDLVDQWLDRSALGARAAEDLAASSWHGPEGSNERRAQQGILERWQTSHVGGRVSPRGSLYQRARIRARSVLAACPPVERAAYRMAGRTPLRHANIVEAVAAHDPRS